MSDSKEDKPVLGRKPLGIKRTVESGQVQQQFSHGRKNTVVVEVKRRRVPMGKPGETTGAVPAAAPEANPKPAAPAPQRPAPPPPPRPVAQNSMLSRKELQEKLLREAEEARMAALEDARRREDAARQAASEEEKRRAEENRLAAEAESQREAEEASQPAPQPAAEEPQAEASAPAAEAAPEAAPAAPAAPASAMPPPRRFTPVTPAKRPEPAKPERAKRGDDNRRQSGKLTVTRALADDDSARARSLAALKRAREKERRAHYSGGSQPREKQSRDVVVPESITVQELANRMAEKGADLVKALFKMGTAVTLNQPIDQDTAELLVEEFGHRIQRVSDADVEIGMQGEEDAPETLKSRPPVVTIMGHVDHGKTSLLDALRGTSVVQGESGGITQHIGAYQIKTKGGDLITFLDTPGHEAFSEMRARGANVTDIVILVVAADDGLMPQTIEAINHARAAEVPIIVAVNKIDKDNADPQRVLTQLAEHELVPEAWGGDTIVVEMAALQDLGIDDLLDQLLVVAELEDLRANPTGRAKGVVLEANLDKGRGPVATVLVDKGELKVGDPIVAGAAWGRVRAMIDDKGQQVKSAGPSTPVEVLGLSSVPAAGDEFRAAPDERIARTVGEARGHHRKIRDQRSDARVKTGVKLEDIFSQIQSGESATLNLVLKADVQGSLEAVTESLRKLGRDEVDLSFVHRAVGAISENDITLAATTNATIIGFNVRPDRKSRELADAQDVEIRTYEIIYKLLEDIEQAMVGMLAPEYEEVVTGDAEVREIFRVPKIGAIAGCYVQNGTIARGSKVRFLRDGTIIWKGEISSLRRFKDDVREVREGFECGIGLSDFQDLKPGDVIETYDEREIQRTLS